MAGTKHPNSREPSKSASENAGSRKAFPRGALAAATIFVALGILAIGWAYQGSGTRRPAPEGPAKFVGSESCAGCHQTQAGLWRGSQHARAMAHAGPDSVLGDFSDRTFEHFGKTSKFFRKDAKYFVETDGPDGKLATFEIKFTFGVEPLQQYLIEFTDGRIQALSVAWDSRPKEQGGQRWFHLYPNEPIGHDDILHWTKLNQNWNFMCAECHSTGVRKNYDAAKDRFATSWSEISVGCEACHGQGSRHVAWAQNRNSWWPFGKVDDPLKGLSVHFDERRDVAWQIDPKSGNSERNWKPFPLRKEVETCGLCHARRGQLSEDWIPGRWLSETHTVSPLGRGLYFADGQMQDEVYNYGSFKQSKMFAAGVTCGDCHEPHSAKLRFPGDGVCLQCHASDKFAAASHRRHASVEPPLACASCHMPARTYMMVDPRHDHSFRIPRPDISAKIGTPNACNGCHNDKPNEWVAAAIERWHGPKRIGFQNFGEAFHAAWTRRPDAAALLGGVAGDSHVPGFARAAALDELAPYLSPANLKLAQARLSDPDPMVRIGALDMLENFPVQQAWPLLSPLLSDSIRGVRIRAVQILATVPAANQPPADRERFDRAAAEFVAAQKLNADRPEARVSLGNFYARQGRAADAETEFKAGLRLNPQFAAAAINLADLYRTMRRDGDGETVLRSAIQASPDSGELHHALGLALVRLKRTEEAIPEFRLAAGLDPDQARYAYVHAVALNSTGRRDEALAVLADSLARHPEDRETLQALVSFNRDAGDYAAALAYAERMGRLTPDDRGLQALIEQLRRQAQSPR